MPYFGLEAEDYDRKYSDSQLLRRAWKYFSPHKGSLAIIGITLVASAVFMSLDPMLISFVVANLDAGDPSGLFFQAIIIASVNLAAFAFNYSRQVHSARVLNDAVFKLRYDAFEAVLRHDMLFFDQNPTGKIASRINNDTGDFGEMGLIFMDALANLCVAVVLLVAMFTVHVVLTLLFFLMFSVIMLVTNVFRRVAREATRKSRRTLAHVNNFTKETVAGIQVLKTFRREQEFFDDFKELNQQAFRVGWRRGMILSVIWPILNMVQTLLLVLVYHVGAFAIAERTIDPDVLYLFILGVFRVFWPLFNVAAFFAQFQVGLSSAERVFSLIDAKPGIKQSGCLKPARLEGSITMKDVRFAYGDGEPVFNGLSLDIAAGEKVAIVGHTGAGKSSLVKLLARLYEFQDGTIEIDGIDVRSLDVSFLRDNMGFISQVPFLWNDTLEANVKFSVPGASRDQVKNALELAGGVDWVESLPAGLDTKLRERGSLLSVGQRQLVNIARIFLEDPRILILDEATASVDPFTETRIQEAMMNVMAGRTTIVIAHRLWTVQHVDRIIVLENGRIVEQGSHEELMKRKGMYRDLYETYFKHQSLEYIEQKGTARSNVN